MNYEWPSPVRVRNHGPIRRLTPEQYQREARRWAEAVACPTVWREDQLTRVAEATGRESRTAVLAAWGLDVNSLYPSALTH